MSAPFQSFQPFPYRCRPRGWFKTEIKANLPKRYNYCPQKYGNLVDLGITFSMVNLTLKFEFANFARAPLKVTFLSDFHTLPESIKSK